MKTGNPKARRESLLIEELPTELLVYDQKRHRAHCLNASAAAVFRSADGSRSVADIVRDVSARLAAPVSEDLVWIALEELEKNELLAAPLPRARDGHSRREFFLKAGAAAAVMVPMVLAITAPTPAYAQSVTGSTLGSSTVTGQTGNSGPTGATGGTFVPTGGITGPFASTAATGGLF